LSWTGGDPDNHTVNYTIYYKAGSSTFTVSDILGYAENTTSYSITPSPSWSTTYYWQIVATDEHDAFSMGPIWQFTTGAKSSSGTGVYIPPTLTLTANAGGPYTGQTGTPVNFTGSATYGSSPYTYSWDFGDDSTGTGATPTHTYTTAGTYTVTLTVTDNAVATDDDTATVTISESPTPTYPPVADAGGLYEGLTFEDITFDGSDSYDSDGSIVNYTWDFGNETILYGQLVTHSYNISGLFNITLTVTDDDGLTDSNTTTITITLDTDGDGLSDNVEERLGSDPTNNSDVTKISIENESYFVVDTTGDSEADTLYNPETDIDNSIKIMQIDGKRYYILDTDNDGIYDTFYNPEKDEYTTLEQDENGRYKVDIDKDGKTDYLYDAASGATSVYYEEDESEGIPVVYLIILLIVIIIILIIAVLFKTGYLYVAEESEEEKPATATKEEKKESPKKSSSTGSKSKKTKKKK
jgi:PKD repeat protein